MNKDIKELIETYYTALDENININSLQNYQEKLLNFIEEYYGADVKNVCVDIIKDLNKVKHPIELIAITKDCNNKDTYLLDTTIKLKEDDISVGTDVNVYNKRMNELHASYIKRLLPVIAEPYVYKVSKNGKIKTRYNINTPPDLLLEVNDKSIPFDVKYGCNIICGSLSAGSDISKEIDKFNDLLTQNNNDFVKTFKSIISSNKFVYLNQIVIILTFNENNYTYTLNNVYIMPLICIIPINWRNNIHKIQYSITNCKVDNFEQAYKNIIQNE